MEHAIKLAESIEYQKGAVVSKTLVKRPTGTVTVFAFDAGQGLSEHTAPFDALVYIIDGQAEITIAGEPLIATAGMLVTMPANQPHALLATEAFKMLLIMIRS